MKSSFLAFFALAASGYAEAAIYSRTASLSGKSFLDAFSWEAIADPTHGRTNYVTQSTARSAGLYSVSGNTVILRADNTTVLSSSDAGRDSFRLQSKDKYSTHVAIFDIGHMPVGCGTWPAVCEVRFAHCIETCTNAVPRPILVVYREVGAHWPNQGEIDILEGVDNKGPNQSTLHTSANCAMPSSRNMTGKSVGNNCDVHTTGNAGCGVRFADSNSFGHNFNNVGGGWYAVERSSTYISIYFWDRRSSFVPSEVMHPGGTVDTKSWGTPTAHFPDTDCNFPSHFGPMHIVINLTFCGSLASALFTPDGCPSTCVDYVNRNPGAFSEAYFELNALNIYQ